MRTRARQGIVSTLSPKMGVILRFTYPVLGMDRDLTSFGKPRPKPQSRGHRNPRERWLAISTDRLPRGVRQARHLGQVRVVETNLILVITERSGGNGRTSHASKYPTTVTVCIGSLFHEAEYFGLRHKATSTQTPFLRDAFGSHNTMRDVFTS